MLDRERWSRTVGRRAGVIQNCKRLDRGATGTSVSPYALLIGGTETPNKPPTATPATANRPEAATVTVRCA